MDLRTRALAARKPVADAGSSTTQIGRVTKKNTRLVPFTGDGRTFQFSYDQPGYTTPEQVCRVMLTETLGRRRPDLVEPAFRWFERSELEFNWYEPGKCVATEEGLTCDVDVVRSREGRKPVMETLTVELTYKELETLL